MRRVRFPQLAILCVLPALLSCAPSGRGLPDYDLRGLKGPVRQVIARHYQVRYDGAGERLLLGVVAITRFDGGGRLKRRLMEAHYAEADSRTRYTIFEYDPSGRRIEERYYEQAVGGLANRSVYTYAGDRLASSADYTYGTQLANRVFYAHDPAGNRTRQVVYWLPLGRGVRILLLREVEP